MVDDYEKLYRKMAAGEKECLELAIDYGNMAAAKEIMERKRNERTTGRHKTGDKRTSKIIKKRG